MKRRMRVMCGYATLAITLVVGIAEASAAPSVKGQTTDTKIPCDEAIGPTANVPKALVVARVSRCLIERGEHIQAAERLQAHLKVMDQDKAQGGRAALEALLKTALSKIGQLEIRTPINAEIMVDGRRIGKSPDVNHVFVDPGAHVIEARKDGVDARKNIEVAAGNTEVVELPIEKKKVEPPKPIVVPPTVPAWRTPTMIVGGGAALVGIIVGIVNVAAAQEAEANRSSLVASFPPGSSKCVNVPAAERCRREADFVAQGERAWQGAGFGFALGGLGIVALTTAILWPQRPTSTKKNDSAAAFTFVPLQGGAAITLRSAF